MAILVTGAAGFIGHAVCRALLERDEAVVGIDNLIENYDPQLKKDRLSSLEPFDAFTFFETDIGSKDDIDRLSSESGPFRKVVHLAAQAGVRNSMDNPLSYINSNVVGHMNILEMCRATEDFEHLVFASSSSVYGANTEPCSSTAHKFDRPKSLYAATKAANELMSYSHGDLFGIPQTGLRFFTVYGPWGRPDMVIWLFTEAICRDESIKVFNYGDMRRDFTYIDDIVDGTLGALDNPPAKTEDRPPFQVFNLGYGQPVELETVIACIEKALGKNAKRELLPMQLGDPKESWADIEATTAALGYSPETSIEDGIAKFIDWYRRYKR